MRNKKRNTVTNVDESYCRFEDTIQEYGPQPQNVLKWIARKYCAPFRSAGSFGHAILDFFPILTWLPMYSWRENFVYDVISGITTGVMFVPQGIAYSYLAGVAPVYGLYSSFFAPLFYVLLGCSPHVSRGPSSVLGAMSGVSNQQIRKAYADDLTVNSALNASLLAASGVAVELAGDVPDAITVAMTLTFTIGLIQLCMGLVRLEFAADYFSEALVGGYTLAAAIHVLVLQSGTLLGIPFTKGSTPGYLFRMLYELLTRLPSANMVAAGASIFGIGFLLVGKDVVNPWINRWSRIKIALPYELMLMIMATVVSQWFNWSSHYHIKVVGEVPKGLPLPRAPRLDLIVYTLPNAAAIAMVTLAMHFSMVKLFASRMHYNVDSGQELYAIGLGSLLSGCFPVYPTSTALGRTMVMVESGAKSQLSTAVSCALVLTIILWFGPLFQPLPQCILSVVVVVALRPIFRKAPEIAQIWRLSRYDAVVWIVSLIATVLTNVITGLCISIIFTLFTVIFRMQWLALFLIWPMWSAKYSHYVFPSEHNGDEPTKVDRFVEYCLFRFDSAVLFTNVQRFEKYVGQTLSRWRLVGRRRTSSAADNGNHYRRRASADEKHRLFVFDFSAMTQIDVAGLAALSKCVTQILREKHAQRVVFIQCHERVRESLLEARIVANLDDDFFGSLSDALRDFRKRLSGATPSAPPAALPLAVTQPFGPLSGEYDSLAYVQSPTTNETLAIRQNTLSSSPLSYQSVDDSCSCNCEFNSGSSISENHAICSDGDRRRRHSSFGAV